MERELRVVSARLARLEIEEAETEVTETQPPPVVRQIQIDDRVVSRNPPYHNGTVIGFSVDGYWVYIRNARGDRKKKALHNVELA